MDEGEFRRRMEEVARWDPWMWIFSIFATQILGAVLGFGILSISYRELAIPLGFLLLGALIAFSLSRKFDASRSYAWERWLPVAVYAAFIYAMSGRSFAGAYLPFSSNVFHPFEYSFLAIFLSWALYPLLAKGEIGLFSLLVVACGTLYGVSDEIHQYFVPGRSCSIEDVALDFLGICTGLALFIVAHKNRGILVVKPQAKEPQ